MSYQGRGGAAGCPCQRQLTVPLPGRAAGDRLKPPSARHLGEGALGNISATVTSRTGSRPHGSRGHGAHPDCTPGIQLCASWWCSSVLLLSSTLGGKWLL